MPPPVAAGSVAMGDGSASTTAASVGATVGSGRPPMGMVNCWPTAIKLGLSMPLAAMMSSTLTSYCWLMMLSVSPDATVWSTGSSAVASGGTVPDGGRAMLGVGSTPSGNAAVVATPKIPSLPRLSHQNRIDNTTTAETMTFRKTKGSI